MSQQKLINIGGDPNDASWRYKMPVLTCKIEGRGNGVKTVLTNVVEVCRSLHTEPQYATKFFGMEVGAVSTWDNKRNFGLVNGKHERQDFQKLLGKFIQDFILCPKCKLPELAFKVKVQANPLLLQKCASCGWSGRNASKHRVKSYIINHPPRSSAKNALKSASRSKVKSVSSKSQGSSKGKKKGGGAEGDGAVLGMLGRESENINKNNNALGGDNDEVWSVDVSEAAVAMRRKEEMESTHGKLEKRTAKDRGKEEKEEEEEEEEAANVGQSMRSSGSRPYMYALKGKMSQDLIGPATVLRSYIGEESRSMLEIIDEVKRIKLSRNLELKKTFQITLEAVCQLESLDSFKKSLKKHGKLLGYFVNHLENGVKGDNSRLFLGCLEEIIAKRNPMEFMERTYQVLMVLYEEDILDEQQIEKWYHCKDDSIIVNKDEADEVKKHALPFMEWLKEDEEDEEEEEEEKEENQGEEEKTL